MSAVCITLGVLGGLGLIFGLILGFAAKKLSVEENSLQVQIRNELPGANCGGCGFLGCDDYAKAVSEGKADPNKCGVGGPKVAAAISSLTGSQAAFQEKQVAFVACQGDCEKSPNRADYYGAKNCLAAKLLPGGGLKECKAGCLGFGSCEAACPFGAISVIKGVAVVDDEKCTGCGVCVSVCPNHLIQLLPASSLVRVACSNTEALAKVAQACKIGCLSCEQCVIKCPQQTIKMENNLPVINYELCIGCGICSEVCKRKVIKRL